MECRVHEHGPAGSHQYRRRIHDVDARLRDLPGRHDAHDPRRRGDLAESDTPMNTNGRNTKVAVLVLGVVAIAGCSSSMGASSTSTTTVTVPTHATTSTTTRRRIEGSTTT